MPASASYLLTGSEGGLAPSLDEQTWRPLRFLNLYRLILGALFALIYQLDSVPTPLGSAQPALFNWVSLAYVAFAMAADVAILRRAPGFNAQVYTHISVDIAAITLLMHSSGGPGSGIGVLLVVSIAAAGMLTAGRMAGFFAALATLAVLIEQFYSHFLGEPQFVSYSRAGMLGATLFATAIIAHVLARRIGESEALAAQRGVDLENMARLTEFVIQQLDAGVLVVDTRGTIRLMNASAWRLLGRPETGAQRTLESVSPLLAERLKRWLTQPGDPACTLPADGVDLLPRFVRMGSAPSGILIFLEDATAAAQQAQQLKLAALGRLTASIAHEVRNPLGAISHAAELLAESEGLDQGDHRLTEIITQQAQRMNTMIESILQLGRRERSQPVLLELRPWLERFVEEFVETNRVPPATLALAAPTASMWVRFDPNHLHQILWNLCLNGLHHAEGSEGGVKVELSLRQQEGRAWLDVADKGPGVPAAMVPHLFEPFFTTKPGGTGLGLFISRELAQCNRSRLEYLPTSQGGAGRFRLSFGQYENGPG